MITPDTVGELSALRWGRGGRTALAVHGITASAMAWGAVARNLPEDWTLVAVDLRGRGASADLPGPYGLARHAADVWAAAERLPAPVTLVGHSMGAYVALLAAADAPNLFDRVVLIDGAIPLTVPADADLDALNAAILGPALARLSRVFSSDAEYVEFWQAHPAFADWNPDMEAYVRYDLIGPPGALRSRVVEAAARTDGRDVLASTERFEKALRGLAVPTLLMTAPAGMLGQPPGLLLSEAVNRWYTEVDALRVESVEGANHYTIVLDPAAAARVARRITDPSSWPQRRAPSPSPRSALTDLAE